MAKSCVLYRVLQRFQHQTLRSPRGVCAESAGRNINESNGFALTYPVLFDGVYGRGGKRLLHSCTLQHSSPAPLSSSENQAHRTPNASHNITLQAQTSCGVGESSFSKRPATKLVNWWTLKRCPKIGTLTSRAERGLSSRREKLNTPVASQQLG